MNYEFLTKLLCYMCRVLPWLVLKKKRILKDRNTLPEVFYKKAALKHFWGTSKKTSTMENYKLLTRLPTIKIPCEKQNSGNVLVCNRHFVHILFQHFRQAVLKELKMQTVWHNFVNILSLLDHIKYHYTFFVRLYKVPLNRIRPIFRYLYNYTHINPSAFQSFRFLK